MVEAISKKSSCSVLSSLQKSLFACRRISRRAEIAPKSRAIEPIEIIEGIVHRSLSSFLYSCFKILDFGFEYRNGRSLEMRMTTTSDQILQH